MESKPIGLSEILSARRAELEKKLIALRQDVSVLDTTKVKLLQQLLKVQGALEEIKIMENGLKAHEGVENTPS